MSASPNTADAAMVLSCSYAVTPTQVSCPRHQHLSGSSFAGDAILFGLCARTSCCSGERHPEYTSGVHPKYGH